MSNLTNNRTSVPQDPSGAVYTITKEHRDTHAGRVFELNLEQASVGTSGYNYLIRVGAKQAHLSYGGVIRGDGIVLRMFEAPTVTTTGSSLTPVNTNRDLADKVAIPTTLLYGGATVSADGTPLDRKYAASGAVGNSGGGTITLDYQWVLRPNTDYLLRVATASGTHTAYTEIKFYEVKV
jgi:hypothetical protein